MRLGSIGARSQVSVGLLLALALAPSPSAASGEQAPVPPTGDTLRISFDPDSDRLAIHARDARVFEVLEALSAEAGFQLTLPEPSASDARATLDSEDASLADVLRRLLQGRDHVLVYDARGRISRLIVAPEAAGAPVAEAASPPDAVRAESAGPEVPASAVRELLEAAVRPEEASIESLVEALRSSDPRRFWDALDRLAARDPARALEELRRQLEETPEGADPGQVRARRIRAARALEVLGGEAATAALIEAFQSGDPELREAAARSLAQIGDERAREFLLQVATGSDPEAGGTGTAALAFAAGSGARAPTDESDRGATVLEDVDEDGLEPVSIPAEGQGCLGGSWQYPSCSRRVPTEGAGDSAEESGAEQDAAGQEPSEEPLAPSEGGCLGPQWRFPSCSRE